MNTDLRVLFLASEADPFVKIGGLGDVAGSLPPALHALGGVDIRLALPFHGAIHRQAYHLRPVASFDVQHTGGAIRAEVLETTPARSPGVPDFWRSYLPGCPGVHRRYPRRWA